jgi:hypothetical protein
MTNAGDPADNIVDELVAALTRLIVLLFPESIFREGRRRRCIFPVVLSLAHASRLVPRAGGGVVKNLVEFELNASLPI